MQDFRRPEQKRHSFGGHQPAHESDHWCIGLQYGMRDRLSAVEPVGYDGNARKMQKVAKPLRLGNIGCGVRAKEPPGECEQPEFPGGKQTLRGIATQTFGVTMGHEMAGAWCRPGLDE